MRRTILGVNIQWIKDGQIIERTLAMQKIKSRHTAENISYMIINLVQNIYGLSMNDLVAATVDNASNMTASVRKIDKFVSTMRHELDSNQNGAGICGMSNSSGGSDSDDQDGEEEEEEEIDEDEESVEGMWLEPEYQKHMLEAVATNLYSTHKPIFHESVETVHCGGHTVQLCGDEALRNSNCGPVVNKARDIVKQLHCQSLTLALEEKHLPVPPIDNNTRWFSTYLMVQTDTILMKVFTFACFSHLIFICRLHSLPCC